MTSPGSPSNSNESSEKKFKFNYLSSVNGPQDYQKKFPDEDFSAFIKETRLTRKDLGSSLNGNDDIPDVILNKVEDARVRILKVFIQNIISLPRLNIAELGAHRHSGQWYFIRNSFLGHILEFLLYKKIHQMVSNAIKDENFNTYLRNKQPPSNPEELIGMINLIISKEKVRQGLEHSLILMKYWEEESEDCKVYQEYITKCLEKL